MATALQFERGRRYILAAHHLDALLEPEMTAAWKPIQSAPKGIARQDGPFLYGGMIWLRSSDQQALGWWRSAVAGESSGAWREAGGGPLTFEPQEWTENGS